MSIYPVTKDSQIDTTNPSCFDFQIDTYKVSHVAANAFLLLALADIVLRLGLSLSSLGFFAAPVAWMLSGGILLISVIFIGGSYYIQEKNKQKNYQNPDELKLMKEAAVNLSFDELLKEHSPEDLVNSIFNEQGKDLSPRALKNKFAAVADETIDFERFNRNYDLKKLVEQGIVTQSFFDFLLDLQEEMDRAQKKYLEEIEKLEATYPIRLKTIERGVASIYDFFLDPYKIVRTCIYYAITSSAKRKSQEAAFGRAVNAQKMQLTNTFNELQKKYKNNYHSHLLSEYKRGTAQSLSEKIEAISG